MATLQVIAQAGTSGQSAALTSTKVKVVSNVSCYYAVGTNPVAYSTGNCFLLPANTIRDINCGPGTQTTTYMFGGAGNVVTGGAGPKIAFLTSAGTALVEVTEIGYVDFSRVTN